MNWFSANNLYGNIYNIRKFNSNQFNFNYCCLLLVLSSCTIYFNIFFSYMYITHYCHSLIYEYLKNFIYNPSFNSFTRILNLMIDIITSIIDSNIYRSHIAVRKRCDNISSSRCTNVNN